MKQVYFREQRIKIYSQISCLYMMMKTCDNLWYFNFRNQLKNCTLVASQPQKITSPFWFLGPPFVGGSFLFWSASEEKEMRRLYREYFGSEPPNLRVPTSGVSGGIGIGQLLVVAFQLSPEKTGEAKWSDFFLLKMKPLTIFTTTDHDGCLFLINTNEWLPSVLVGFQILVLRFPKNHQFERDGIMVMWNWFVWLTFKRFPEGWGFSKFFVKCLDWRIENSLPSVGWLVPEERTPHKRWQQQHVQTIQDFVTHSQRYRAHMTISKMAYRYLRASIPLNHHPFWPQDLVVHHIRPKLEELAKLEAWSCHFESWLVAKYARYQRFFS